MSISYPLTLPSSPTFRNINFAPLTAVGAARSPFTGSTQVALWPGQWWAFKADLPPLGVAAERDAWTTFKLKLNGQYGTFYFGDMARRTSLASPAPSGTWKVGAGNVANAPTLTLKSGTNAFVVGDYLQIFSGSSAKLHRITQVNSQYSYEVWPYLRSAYAEDSAVTYSSPVGVFRLADNNMDWTTDVAKFCGVTINAVEAL